MLRSSPSGVFTPRGTVTLVAGVGAVATAVPADAQVVLTSKAATTAPPSHLAALSVYIPTNRASFTIYSADTAAVHDVDWTFV